MDRFEVINKLLNKQINKTKQSWLTWNTPFPCLVYISQIKNSLPGVQTPDIVLYIGGGGDNTLVYKDISSLLQMVKIGWVRESQMDGELLRYDTFRFIPGVGTDSECLTSLCFSHGRLIHGSPTIPPPELTPRQCDCSLPTTDYAHCWLIVLFLGLKISIIIYFSDAYTIFPTQFLWYFSVLCLP